MKRNYEVTITETYVFLCEARDEEDARSIARMGLAYDNPRHPKTTQIRAMELPPSHDQDLRQTHTESAG